MTIGSGIKTIFPWYYERLIRDFASRGLRKFCATTLATVRIKVWCNTSWSRSRCTYIRKIWRSLWKIQLLLATNQYQNPRKGSQAPWCYKLYFISIQSHVNGLDLDAITIIRWFLKLQFWWYIVFSGYNSLNVPFNISYNSLNVLFNFWVHNYN